MGAQNPFSRQPGGQMPPMGMAPPMSGSPYGQQTGIQNPQASLGSAAPPMGMAGMNPGIGQQLQRMFGPGAAQQPQMPQQGSLTPQQNLGMLARGLMMQGGRR